MKTSRRFRSGSVLSRKWVAFAALTLGTTLQVSACREEFGLFGLRWAFSTFTLPINVFIRDLLLGIV